MHVLYWRVSLKVSKVNLRSCSLIPSSILYPSFINPPVVSPDLDSASDSSRIEVDDNLTLTTIYDNNLL